MIDYKLEHIFSYRGMWQPCAKRSARCRKDGVDLLDVRTTFETHDGALILVTYQGAADFGEDGHDKFLRGDLPPAVQIRIPPRFLTSHSEYLWLKRPHFFGAGEYCAATNDARYDVYSVR